MTINASSFVLFLICWPFHSFLFVLFPFWDQSIANNRQWILNIHHHQSDGPSLRFRNPSNRWIATPAPRKRFPAIRLTVTLQSKQRNRNTERNKWKYNSKKKQKKPNNNHNNNNNNNNNIYNKNNGSGRTTRCVSDPWPDADTGSRTLFEPRALYPPIFFKQEEETKRNKTKIKETRHIDWASSHSNTTFDCSKPVKVKETTATQSLSLFLSLTHSHTHTN